MKTNTCERLLDPARIVHIVERDAELQRLQARIDYLEGQVASWAAWHVRIAATLVIAAAILFGRGAMPALLAQLLA